MKLLFTFCLLSFFIYGAHAQCKYERNEYDRFLNINIKETKAVLYLGMSERVNINFISAGDSLLAKVMYSATGFNSIVVPETKPMLFIMENDSVVTLYPVRLAMGIPSTVGGLNLTMTTVSYGIDQAAAIKLSTMDIKAFRMYFTDSYLEHDVKPGKADKIKTALDCVLRK